MLLGMRKLLFIALLLYVSTARLFGQLEHADAETKAKCEKYLQTPLPAEAATVASPIKFPTCESLYFYYGSWDTPSNFTAARKCAWEERAFILKEGGKLLSDPNTPIPLDMIAGGPATLAMIYANGLSVPRNIPLAMRFVCEASYSDYPIDTALNGLEAAATKPSPVAKKDYFKMCEYQGTTPIATICAEWDEQARNDERLQTIRTLTMNWKPSEISAFLQLRIYADTYFHSHAVGELNRAGTARGIQATEELGKFRDGFLNSLKTLNQHLPLHSLPDDYRKVDLTLNEIYGKLLKNADAHKSEYGTVQPEGIRDTERAWLKYRDAWVAFAKLHYPSVNEDTWLTLLTNDRTAVLKGTFCEIGSGDEPCDDEVNEQSPSPSP
jgi:uncharacterized protein YecT (DUF1311 family)